MVATHLWKLRAFPPSSIKPTDLLHISAAKCILYNQNMSSQVYLCVSWVFMA